jgi:hypothetical protein
MLGFCLDDLKQEGAFHAERLAPKNRSRPADIHDRIAPRQRANHPLRRGALKPPRLEHNTRSPVTAITRNDWNTSNGCVNQLAATVRFAPIPFLPVHAVSTTSHSPTRDWQRSTSSATYLFFRVSCF